MTAYEKSVRDNILTFIEETKQSELRHVIYYCIGYYDAITPTVWRVIHRLIETGIVH